jgi:hypothetical protein
MEGRVHLPVPWQDQGWLLRTGDSVGGCELLDARNIFNQRFELELFTPAFDPWGENQLDELEDE